MSKDEEVNGPRIAAEILSRMAPETQTRIVANIEASAPELALKISDEMFRFDDIAELPDRSIQVLAQAVNHHDLVVALKKALPKTKEKIYQNISERKRSLLTNDGDTMAPVKSSEVDFAQRRIMNTLEELRQAGKIRTESIQDVWV
ncbi:MAG: hypothetical protein KDD70_04545 [Bdellovibrionales bacterium]|nr:hypothetical protein [Bdellovibrionales bacterium]